ncbi:MAG: PAS domain S-box protein [Desulfobacterales bacterium]|nr:MAG: PAS domain S-box protein [Desulfobacterales bacterium]
MATKPTRKELEQRIKALENKILDLKGEKDTFLEQLSISKKILSTTPDLLVFKDTNFVYQAVNPAFCRFLDKPEEDIIGQTDFDLFPNTEANLYRQDDAKVMASGKPQIQNEEVTGAGGAKQWLEVAKNPVIDETGKSIGVLCSVRDLTEARRSENALQESADLLESIFRAAPTGIGMVHDRVITQANERLCDILGYSKDELLGQGARILYPSDEDFEYVGQEKYRQIRDKGTGTVETRWQRKDGKVIDVLLSSTPLDLNDLSIGVTFTALDISERKQAEKALLESEEKYRNLVENANDAIFVIQDGMVKFPNSKLEDVTGYTMEELSAIQFANLIHPEDRDMVLERRKKRLMGENPPSIYSFRLINKSGEKLWVQINTAFIMWEGTPATINFIRDITEQKRLESQLQQIQRMESLSTLAGGIAHDFNNLLMGIQGRASLMLMDVDSHHHYVEHLKGIEDSVKSAADLTKQLLGFARGGKYEVKPTDLNEVATKTYKMFGRTKKELTIHQKRQDDIWAVEVDQSQIEQVLLNLYVNAWQSMPGEGEIYLETENVLLDADFVEPYSLAPGKYVKISVTDTGIGMDKVTQARIFDPFFTTKEMGRGTGLGLASAYGIIKNHNGIINVYSEKGEGTTFNIYLPASEKEVIEDKKLVKYVLNGSETVLFVDDEDTIIDVGKSMLEKIGYQVLIAKNGREAIEIYNKNMDKIKIVILDMIMPAMGGGETYDTLKEINPDIKVLLSSGYSINGQATEIIERGCNGFIQKPFNVADLSQKIREILGKKNRFDIRS